MPFRDEPVLDRLPAEIQFLAEPVRRYRVDNGESAIDEKLATLTSEQIEELKAIGKRVYDGRFYHNQIARFIDDYDMVKYDESARLYFFFGLLDNLDIEFDHPDDIPYISAK